MDSEAYLTFIYKTINSFNEFEEYIEQKLQSNYGRDKLTEGYLIDKKYYDYWKKFSNYDELRYKIKDKAYQSVRQLIYQKRISNRLQNYQSDAHQIIFNSPEELLHAVKNEGKSYVLIDNYIWELICYDRGLKERGGMKYSVEKNTINFYFGENENCQIRTFDNIIDDTKEILISGNNNNNKNNNNNYNNNYNNNNYNNNNYNNIIRKITDEELELQKILLLYAFEQELKNKINNLTYKEKFFNKYYLISKEWIIDYKKCYHYEEMSKMIRNRDSLKNLLNKGYNYAKNNINTIINKISVNKSAKKNFPDKLRDNNTFLCERDEVKISNKYIISYWKNFELVNEDLKNLLSDSELHGYHFENASDAKCLISCGKVIIDLSNDDYNENNYACEIGVISNIDMFFNDEYIFRYDNEENKNENLSYFKDDFLNFQKENINLGIDLESELLSKDGNSYGTAFKIPPHD